MFDYYKYLDDDSINVEILDYLAQVRCFTRGSSYPNLELAKIEIADSLLRSLGLPTEPTIHEQVEAFVRYKKSSIPASLRWMVFERDDFRCKHCGCRANLQADHIHPESEGGETTLENLQTLCRRCNSKKGKKCAEKN